MSISRRQILFRLAGLASIARASGASAQKRRYRVAATISVLGAPVITRQNVGTAFLMLHEIDEAERRIVRLHFAGESNAERGAWPRVRGLDGRIRDRASFDTSGGEILRLRHGAGGSGSAVSPRRPGAETYGRVRSRRRTT